MKGGVLLDTGPLVAYLDRRDRYHDWAKDQMSVLRPPLLTCEPVLAEAFHLLRALGEGRSAILDMMRRGLIEVPFRLTEHIDAVNKLLSRYEDRPISLADACLVRMSEVYGDTVLTLDSDFKVYRRHRRQKIPLITPKAW